MSAFLLLYWYWIALGTAGFSGLIYLCWRFPDAIYVILEIVVRILLFTVQIGLSVLGGGSSGGGGSDSDF